MRNICPCTQIWTVLTKTKPKPKPNPNPNPNPNPKPITFKKFLELNGKVYKTKYKLIAHTILHTGYPKYGTIGPRHLFDNIFSDYFTYRWGGWTGWCFYVFVHKIKCND